MKTLGTEIRNITSYSVLLRSVYFDKGFIRNHSYFYSPFNSPDPLSVLILVFPKEQNTYGKL